MISNRIEDLIIEAKSMPNSENRNRGISHLKDALAHFQVLESYDKTTFASVLPEPFFTPSNSGGCACRPGMMDKKCPYHGGSSA